MRLSIDALGGKEVRPTWRQEDALEQIGKASRPISAPAVNATIATIRALAKAGLVEWRGGSGRFATWVITAAGREYLEKRAYWEDFSARQPKWGG